MKKLEVAFDLYYSMPGNSHLKPLRNIVLAHCALESGHGSSYLYTEYNNGAGMKFREILSYMFPKFGYYIDHAGEKARYFKLSSMVDFPALYWAFINRWPYVGWEKYINDPFGYIRHISKIYCATDTPEVYYNKVIAVYNLRMDKQENNEKEQDMGFFDDLLDELQDEFEDSLKKVAKKKIFEYVFRGKIIKDNNISPEAKGKIQDLEKTLLDKDVDIKKLAAEKKELKTGITRMYKFIQEKDLMSEYMKG